MFERLISFRAERRDRWRPLKHPTLGISWVQGRLHAVFFDKKQRVSHWSNDSEVSTVDEFRAAITKACRALGVPKNSDVAMVYESEKLSHPFIQVPPMSSKDLESFLARRVLQEKAFEDEAAWSRTQTFAAKEGQGVLLHLLPKDFLREIIQSLEGLRLFPKVLLPLSEVMAQHVSKLPVDDDVIVAMVATFSGETDILIARGDGKILFIRDLGYNWQDNVEVLVRDIDRSILYAKQQFGVAVSVLSIAGDGAEDLDEQLRQRINLPVVNTSEDDHHAYCWAEDICSLSPRRTSNLIPHHVQYSRLENTIWRLSVFAAAVLIVSTILILAQVEIVVSTSPVVHNAKQKLAGLRDQRTELREKVEAAEALKKRLIRLSRPSKAAYPLYFFSYLGEVLSPELVLDSATVNNKDGVLYFTLTGVAAHSTDATSLIRYMNALQHRLSGPPLHAVIDNSWRQSPDKILGSGSSNVSKQLAFTLKGVMK